MNKADIKTLRDLVIAADREHGSHVFVREKAGKDIAEKTFSEFYTDVKKVSAFIRSKRQNGKVHSAIIGPSSYAWIVGWFGTVCGGDTAVPLDAQLPPDEIADLLRRADVSVFFYDDKFEKIIPAIKEACPDVTEYISLGAGLAQILNNFPADELPVTVPEDLAAIAYTSGTTGKSKGVMLTNGNYIDNTMCQDDESTPDDVLLSVLPIHHIYCFTCDILLTLRYGGVLCFNDSMMRIPVNLKLFRPTIMLIVPMIAMTLLKQIQKVREAKPDIPMAAIANDVFGGRLKTIYSGGAYLPTEVQKAYIDMGITMCQGYGMTECSPRISTGNPSDTECAGDVGVIVNGCQVKTEDGEILAKSPSVMAGYYKDSEETAKTLTSDGWLRTGDLGYVDSKNRIFITGRKKNLIILSNGENVSPEELENKFAGIDFVAEVMVYSDEGVITAEIFPAPDCGLSVGEIEDKFRDLVARINKTVVSAKTIRRLRIRDNEFEKTTSRKIVRNQTSHGRRID